VKWLRELLAEAAAVMASCVAARAVERMCDRLEARVSGDENRADPAA
jgi:hypothetical protein